MREGGREGRKERSQGREKKKGGALHGMSESAGRGRERLEKEGEQGAEGRKGGGGGRDREMGVHANFIILLINFSSSNPPAGT